MYTVNIYCMQIQLPIAYYNLSTIYLMQKEHQIPIAKK